MDEELFQAFRCRSTGDEIDIPVQKDTTTNELVVLWSDIQDGFENAKSVRNGRALVPFKKDNDGNHVKPQRIRYHPGIVLEVITRNDNQLAYTRVAVDVAEPWAEGTEQDQDYAFHSQSLVNGTIGVNPPIHNTTTPVVVGMDTDNQTLVKYSEGSSDSSSSMSSQPYEALHAFTTEQLIQTAGIKQLNRRLGELQDDNEVFHGQLLQTQQQLLQELGQTRDELLQELEKTRRELVEKQQETLELQKKLDERHGFILQLQQSTKEEFLRKQEEIQYLQQSAKDELLKKQDEIQALQQSAKDELLKKQNEIQSLQESVKDELLKKQDEMLDLQRQTLNRLAIILNHVRALLTQTYELHEYPIPRLFIVLPKSMKLLNKFTNPFSEQFRLYFLCECGTHTMPEGSKIPPEVHLAKHEGYDLEKPKEFFERYGAYINAMLCMIKYGIIAGSIVVPPLANLKILDGLETSGKNVDYLKRNIAPLVNDTINLLQDLERNGDLVSGLTRESKGFDKLEALEGVDLRQLESYLKYKDRGRVLGNLYRVVTHEGHVKWVCFDHYRVNYRESAMKELRETVNQHMGKFNEDVGRIEIDITTSLLARSFYEAMVKARGTHELTITLKWDATMDDLRELCDAVTKANVIRMTLNGAFFKSPPIDFVNRGRRFDPILKLAANARIQSLQLIGFEDFFTRVTKYTSPAPKLRLFSMEWKTVLDNKTIKLFNGFLEYCSGLKVLDLMVHEQYPTTKDLIDTLTLVNTLESLRIHYERFSTTTSILQGKVQDASMTVPELSLIRSEDLKFIRRVPFTRLVIVSIPSSDIGDQLADILHQNQGLICLQIGGRDSSVTNPKVEMRPQDLMKHLAPTSSTKLQSLSIDYGRFNLTANFVHGITRDMTMRFDLLQNLTSDDHQFIQQGPYNQLRIEHAQEDDDEPLISIIRQSSVIEYIHLGHNGGQRSVITTTTGMALQTLVNLATSESLSRIEPFSVHCRRLSLTASYSQGTLHDMTMTIDRLGSLDTNDLTFIHQGHLIQLVIVSIPASKNEERLADILRHNPRLARLHIRHQGHSQSDTRLELPLQNLMRLITLEAQSRLQSFSVNNGRVTLSAAFFSQDTKNMTMSFERLDNLSSSDLQFIQQGPYNQLRIEYTQMEDEGQLIDILRQSSVPNHIRVSHHGDRYTVIAVSVDMKLHDLVNMVTLENPATLSSLSVDCRRLSLVTGFSPGGLQWMTLTINQIESLNYDDVDFIHQGHLTQLVIESAPLSKDESILNDILRHNLMLTRLQIEHQDCSEDSTYPELPLQNLVKMVTSDALTHLESFSVNCGRFAMITTFSQGKIRDMTMSFNRLDELSTDDLQFIRQGPYSQLRIDYAQKEDEGPLGDILRQRSVPNHLRIRCHGERYIAIAVLSDMMLLDLMNLAISEDPSMLDSLSVHCPRLALTASYSHSALRDMAITVNRLENLDTNDLKFICQGSLTQLVIASTLASKDEDRLADIFRHSPRLVRFHIQHQDCSESDTSSEMPLRNLVKLTTSETQSRLQSFSINYGRLAITMASSEGKTQDMTMTFSQVGDLTLDDIMFIQQGPYSQLRIEYTQLDDEGSLGNILRQSSAQSRLRISHRGGHYIAIAVATIMKLQDLVSLASLEDSTTLESFSVDCRRLTLSATFSQDKAKDMTLSFGCLDDLTLDDLQFIQEGLYSQLRIEHALKEDEEPLMEILGHSLAHNYLRIRSHGERSIIIAVATDMRLQDLVNVAISENPSTLESFSADCGRLTLSATFSQDGAKDMTLSFDRLDQLSSSDLQFIQQGPYSQLRIEHTRKEDEGPLDDILCQGPMLNHIRIRHHGERSIIIAVATDMRLQDLVNMAMSESPGTLESFSVACGRLTLSATFSQDEAKDMTLSFDRLDELSSSDLQFIQQGPYNQLRIEHTRKEDEGPLCDVLRQGSMLNHIRIRHQGERSIIIAVATDMRLQDLMNMAISENPSTLESFSVRCQRLTLSTCFLEDRTKDMTLSFDRLDKLSSSDLQFIQQGPYSQLRIEHTRKEDEGPLCDILRQGSMLNHIRIRHQGERSITIAVTTDMRLQDLVNMAMSENPSTLESFSTDCGRLTLSATFSQDGAKDMTLSFDRLDQLSSSDLQFIQQGPYSQLRIEHTRKEDEGPLCDILRHGQRLNPIRIKHHGERSIIIAVATDMRLQDLVNMAMSENPSTLESFLIRYQRLTLSTCFSESRAKDMTMAIRQIKSLNCDDVDFIHQGHLTQLVIESAPLSKDASILKDILRHNLMLTRLQIEHQDRSEGLTDPELSLQDLVELITSDALTRLESFSVNCGRFAMTTTFSQGEIQDVAISFNRLDDLSPDDLQFIQQGLYSQLRIEYVQKEDEGPLVDILRQRFTPNYLGISHHGEQYVVIAVTSYMKLQDLVNMAISDNSTTLEVFSVNCRRFTLEAGFSQSGFREMTMTIKQFEGLNYDDIAFIHQGHLTQLVIESALRLRDESVLKDILRRNPMLAWFHIEHRNHFECMVDPELPLQNVVKLITSESLTHLQSFSANCGKFSVAMTFSQSKTWDMILSFNRLDILSPVELQFIQQCSYDQLRIEHIEEREEGPLIDILRQVSAHSYLRITRYGDRSIVIAVTTDMKLQDLVNMATSENPSNLESFSVVCQRLNLNACFSEGRTHDMAMGIKELAHLNLEDMRFIMENHLTWLAIQHTPRAGDGSRLTKILNQCPFLSHLKVGCKLERSLVTINLVLYTRESIIAQGRLFNLRTFELANENLDPFDVLNGHDGQLQCHLSFPEGSRSFNMRTWIRTGGMANEAIVSNFVTHYGWSVVFFDKGEPARFVGSVAPPSFEFDGYHRSSNALTTFSEMSETKTPQLESLVIDFRDSWSGGVDLLDNIIQRSPNFKDLGLYVGNPNGNEQLQLSLSLLKRHGARLWNLRLNGYEADVFSGVASAFPTRNNFPRLESLELWPWGSATAITLKVTLWIVFMVSAPFQSPTSPSASQRLSQDTIADSKSELARSWTPLKKVLLRQVELRPAGWRRVIEALDISTLEHLDLMWSNIVQEQLELLVDRITDSNVPHIPLKTLNIVDTTLIKTTDPDILGSTLAKLRKKAPLVKVIV
ncbi:MAG: hypothetical protein J3Q66DRAFT_427847 [Benniella sp.]|nr:MAG: hypothetical protein J3Q66DRAFT_427847 [Benniella sp.]